MQLTDQMKAEVNRISKHINGMYPVLSSIRNELAMIGSYIQNCTPKIRKYITENTKVLCTYKVRLESLLCETDSKEQDH